MRGRVLAVMAAMGLAILGGGASALQVGGPRSTTIDQMSATGAPAIRGYFVGLRGQCAGQAPRAERDAIQAADVNNDGQLDFLVAARGLTCSGRPMPAASCGPQGCGYTLFVSGGGDYQRADFTAHQAMVVRSGMGWAVMADGQTFGGDGNASTAPVEQVTGGPLTSLPPPEAPVPSTMGMDGFAYGEATLADLRGVRSAELQQSLRYAQDDCGGAALDFAPGGITTEDINRDGRPDYLIAMASMTCGGQSQETTWCGTAGCTYDLYVSRGGDYAHESYSADNAEIVRHDDGLALSLLGRGGETFWVWNGSAMVQTTAPAPMSSTPPPTAAALPRGGDEAAVRAVVASIYDAYAAGFDSGVSVPDNVETPAFQRAVQSMVDPDIGALEADYYCGCQDYDNVSYSIGAVTVDGARATASVNFSNFGGRPERIDLVLARSAGGAWQVDDVIDQYGSLRRNAGM